MKKNTVDEELKREMPESGAEDMTDGEGKGALSVDTLIEKGKKGKLSQHDLDDAMEKWDFDVDQIDKMYEELEDNGINFDGDLSAEEMSAIESEVAQFSETDVMVTSLEQDGVNVDAPVRLYLKEIGKIPLLDADQEMKLAERIAAGDEKAKNELNGAQGIAIFKDGVTL